MTEIERDYKLTDTEPPRPPDGYVAFVWERYFLNAFMTRYGEVTQAAKWAGVTMEMVEQRVREAPQFAALLDSCRKELIGTLKSEAVRRSLEPERTPILYRGRIVGYQEKYDNRLLMWLLERLEPETFHLQTRLEAGVGEGETVFRLELKPGGQEPSGREEP